MPKRKWQQEQNDNSDQASSSSANGIPSKRNHVHFGPVTVFYFKRSQGFGCVPSVGGYTLGMKSSHHSTHHLSLKEHESLIDSQQKQTLQRQMEVRKIATTVESDSDDEETKEMEDGEAEEEETNECLLENDDEYYLQPLTGRERKQLLESAGIEVDKNEKSECQLIRISRQQCGCSCQDECNPETCQCAKDDIKCQVDRPSFPCACSISSCSNPFGRVEFNALRVRSHYLQTMMNIRLQQQGKFGNLQFVSPTHIKFDDDGSTYCAPPLPPIYIESQTETEYVDASLSVNNHLYASESLMESNVHVNNINHVPFPLASLYRHQRIQSNSNANLIDS